MFYREIEQPVKPAPLSLLAKPVCFTLFYWGFICSPARREDPVVNEDLSYYRSSFYELINRSLQYPYLPIWGELFCLLNDFRKMVEREGKSMKLYDLNPHGSMYFAPDKRKFVAEVDGLYFNLTLPELVDALVEKRFLPKFQNSETTPTFAT